MRTSNSNSPAAEPPQTDFEPAATLRLRPAAAFRFERGEVAFLDDLDPHRTAAHAGLVAS